MRFISVIVAASLSLVKAAENPLKTHSKDTILANRSLLTKENIQNDVKPAPNNFDHWCNAFVSQKVEDVFKGLDKFDIVSHCSSILIGRLTKLTLDEMIELKNKGLLAFEAVVYIKEEYSYDSKSPCVKIAKLLEQPGISQDVQGILMQKCSIFLPINSFDSFNYHKFELLKDRPIGKKEIDASKPVLKYERDSWCRKAIENLSTYSSDIQSAFLAKCELFTKVLDDRSEDYLKSLTITDEMVQSSTENGFWCLELLDIGKANLKFSHQNVWENIVRRCGSENFYKLDGHFIDSIYLDSEIIENSSKLNDTDLGHWCFAIKLRHFHTLNISDASLIAKIEEKCTKDVFEVLETFSLDQLKKRGENFSNLLISSSSSFDSTVTDHWCSKLRQIGLSAELYLKVENECKRDPFDLDTLSVAEIQGSNITLTILALSGKSFCNDNDKIAAIVDLREMVEKKCQPLPEKLDGLSADEIFINSLFFDNCHAYKSGVYDGTPSHWCHSVLKFEKFFRAPFLNNLDSKCKLLSDHLAEEAKKPKVKKPEDTLVDPEIKPVDHPSPPENTTSVKPEDLDVNIASVVTPASGDKNDSSIPQPGSNADSGDKIDSSTPQTGSNVDSSTPQTGSNVDSSTPQTGSNVDSASQNPTADSKKKSGNSARSIDVGVLSVLIVLILAFCS